MTSIFPIAYGFSKFASGVLGARSSPSLLLGGGLVATALVNICFGFGASMTWCVANASAESSANASLLRATPFVSSRMSCTVASSHSILACAQSLVSAKTAVKSSSKAVQHTASGV